MTENVGEDNKTEASSVQKRHRPGRSYLPRPIVINGKNFDPFHPPKLIQNSDGTQEHVGGREMSPDEADKMYAARFWEGKPPGLREAMTETIKKDAQTGRTSIFVDKRGITERDKEKLSARRELARELGFEVGPFTFNENAYTATATIKPITK